MINKCISTYLIASLIVLCFSKELSAQQRLSFGEDNYLGSYHITVGYDKTTHLIFPHKIVYVDLGSADLLAEKVEQVENILKLKANVEGFSTTNLTVLTGSGSYFSFLVDYAIAPKELNIVLAEKTTGKENSSTDFPLSPFPRANDGIASTGAKALFENKSLNQTYMEKLSGLVMGRKQTRHLAGLAKYNMRFALHGLYIQDDLFFYHLQVANRSNISYDIDFIRFFIRDKKVGKRTASQEREIFPHYIFNPTLNTIPGNGSLDQVYVMEKVTIPDDKVLRIELFEKKGGRHLSFLLTNKDILKAGLLQ
ncbi:conjugative transposon protein TraN [Rhodocytophaga rosea]|uniref:Conjugative transposon protein TraN n=1 Tax=Rhodocytophaga rosea TaxID=2704465 RepID=A0A6C0GS32_9BACT|nr:conjugative transposon protein TraN [Rhodocytophaga rosea]QHT70747.1 conjugative transposon protein TraN [Rhodocytophaga rosea]